MLASDEFAQIAREQRPTVLLSVPFLFRRYIEGLERDPELTWRNGACAAASPPGEPVPPPLIDRWRRLAGVDLQAHYG